jgi:hypothetical protein
MRKIVEVLSEREWKLVVDLKKSNFRGFDSLGIQFNQ